MATFLARSNQRDAFSVRRCLKGVALQETHSFSAWSLRFGLETFRVLRWPMAFRCTARQPPAALLGDRPTPPTTGLEQKKKCSLTLTEREGFGPLNLTRALSESTS